MEIKGYRKVKKIGHIRRKPMEGKLTIRRKIRTEKKENLTDNLDIHVNRRKRNNKAISIRRKVKAD